MWPSREKRAASNTFMRMMHSNEAYDWSEDVWRKLIIRVQDRSGLRYHLFIFLFISLGFELGHETDSMQRAFDIWYAYDCQFFLSIYKLIKTFLHYQCTIIMISILSMSLYIYRFVHNIARIYNKLKNVN